MRVSPLSAHEAALQNANLVVEIDHTDLTEAAANTAQTIPLFAVPANNVLVECVRSELVVPFEDTSDTAHNSTAVVVGDGGSTNRLLTSTQLNRNGTEVYEKAGTGTKHNYTSADTVDAVFTPNSADALASLNKGKLKLYFQLNNRND
ncbi:MAG TPA: hypothetical protein VEB22_03705 [Phycisphaerales bacterium]|nr:hypothetical protein [Phycisphaerales bacterium]